MMTGFKSKVFNTSHIYSVNIHIIIPTHMWCNLVTCCPGIHIVLQMFNSASRACMCVASFNFPLRLPTLTMLQFCHWLMGSHTPLIRGKLPLAKRIHAKCKMSCDGCCSVSHHKAVVYSCLISSLLWKPLVPNWNWNVWLSAYWRSVCDTRLLVFPFAVTQ